jgi:hypothetical protein
VTGEEVAQLIGEMIGEAGHVAYVFIVFHERLVDGAALQIWEFKQEGGAIVIAIHATEIRQTLLKPHGVPSPAYWQLGSLKRLWSTLTDPYATMNSLADPQWFFGQRRRAMIGEILSEINAGVGLFTVFGMRRVGKTALLNQLALACQERRYPVAKILCRPLSSQYTYADVLSEIIREWSASLEALYPDLLMPSPSPLAERYSPKTASRFKSDVRKLAEVVQQQTNQSPKFVLILDEVDQVFPNPNRENSEEACDQYVNLAQILKSVIEAPGQASMASMVTAMEYPWIHVKRQLEMDIDDN